MSQAETAFASDELIARVECLSLDDGDAYPGVLSVSLRRLSFLPIVRDAASPVRPWEVPLRDVRELELDGMESTLVIRTVDHNRTLMGTELSGLLESIESALQNQPAGGAFGSDEAVVIEGPMDLYINGLLATRGHLVVTQRGVRFDPGRSLESMIWGEVGINLTIDAITDVELTGMRRRLVIRTEDKDYTLRGGLSPRVYGVLSALKEGSSSALSNAVVATWTGSLYAGLGLTQPGEIVLTRSRVKFTPAGRLEALIGLQRELDLALSDITRVDVEGLIDRRLVISVGQEEYAFVVPKPLDRASEIKDLLLGIESERDPIVPLHGARRATPEIMQLLERWSDLIGPGDEEEVLLFGPGLHQGRKHMCRRGWICLTSARVLFLPAGGPESGELPIMAALPVLSAKGREDAPPGELNLTAGDSLIRFVPRGGEGFVDTFFFLWREELERTDEFHFKKHGLPFGAPKVDDLDGESALSHLGFVNRRESYRAVTHGMKTVTIEVRSLMNPAHDHYMEARLRDISLGGCSLITDKRLPERSEFGVELKVGEETASVNARMVYCLRLGRRRVQWRQGLAFLDMRYKDAQLVRDLVMKLQREELTRRAEFREDDPTDEV